jgi:hypothetical protein
MCPCCQVLAPPVVPSDVSGTFHHQVQGPGPQNTGIHDLDTHIDRVIGQHAAQGHAVVTERVSEKRRVMARENVTGDYLSRNLDGSYRAMTSEEKAIHDRSQNIHMTAMKMRRSRNLNPSR